MAKNLGKRCVALLSLMLVSYLGLGQTTQINKADERLYRQALELFEKEKYASAQHLFDEYLGIIGNKNTMLKGNAEFYKAMCGIHLENGDAEREVRNFVMHYPENQKVNYASFALGNLYFKQKSYADAIYWFNRVDVNALGFNDRCEAYFKKGLSYYYSKKNDFAAQAFAAIKDIDNKYSSPATYYYSQIAYEEKNYATALKGFQTLLNDESFGPIAPYYIVQINYIQRNYEKVIEIGPKLLESSTPARTAEISRLIGESYYRLKMYSEALPYINRYAEEAKNLTREDSYLIGFINFKANNHKKAVESFERIVSGSDSLSQNAYYHLAYSQMQLDAKQKALQAFSMASKMSFDKDIQEDALFNFAKLTFELNFNPFNEAITAFNSYIEKYPNSQRVDDAYEYLMIAYTNTKNYKAALESLQKIKKQDVKTKSAIQRLAYYRGLEQFQNLNFSDAIKSFEQSLANSSFNRTLAALALYWKGESLYRLEDYDEAKKIYGDFLLTAGAYDQPEYKLAHYGMGYSNFKQKSFDESMTWFRKFVAFKEVPSNAALADAYNRIGDILFFQRKYWMAIESYDKAFALNASDPDYALFQRSFALGLVDRPERKIESMNSLIVKFPKSPYVDDALFEIGRTYTQIEQFDRAEETFQKLVDKNKGSSYYVKSLVELGLINVNKNNDDKALEYYKKVVEDFPGTNEAKNSLLAIKEIYIDKNDVDSYFSYAQKIGKDVAIGMAEKDSLMYSASERAYLANDCAKAIPGFKKYIATFPNGDFLLSSYYYLADCQERTGSMAEAASAYKYVSEMPKNQFSEISLKKYADISFGIKSYKDAYHAYEKLEVNAENKTMLLDSRIGMMRSASFLNQHQQAADAATKLIATEKVTPELVREAHYVKGKALFTLQDLNGASAEFAQIATNVRTKEGAEAKYMKILISYQQKKLDDIEKEVFEFADLNTPFQMWIAKSFLILGKVYLEKNDAFQAKATIQSIVDGYTVKDDGVIDEANKLLKEVEAAEQAKQNAQQAPVEVIQK